MGKTTKLLLLDSLLQEVSDAAVNSLVEP